MDRQDGAVHRPQIGYDIMSLLARGALRHVGIKRVLVTGASGFVGRPLVAALVDAGYSVRAAMRYPASFANSVDIVIVPDFTKPIDWTPIVRGVDIVIHLAGLAHTDSRDSMQGIYEQINSTTTRDLARAAKEAGIERFVYMSSVRAQTGPSAPKPVREDDEPHPTDHYGRSKLAAELAVQSAGIPFTILRPVVIYGPRSRANIKKLIQLAKLPLPLPFGGFAKRRSLLGIDNLISAIFFVLNNKTTIGETFLVADSAPLTLPEIFALLRKAQGRKPGLIYVPTFLIRLALLLSGQRKLWNRINEDMIADTGKLESLGWHPPVETYEGLRSALADE